MEFVSNLVSSSYSTVSSNKLATAGSVAGLYYMYRRYMQYYEEEMQKFYVKQKYFKESQETSDKTVEGFLPQIEEMVETLSSVNSILSQLQNNLTSPSKLQRSEKKELWMQLKNQVFIKATVSIYCICYEVLVVRLLVNILGKYLYQDSIETENAADQILYLNPKIQREFLTLSRYLISQGFQNFYETINQAIKQIVEELSIEKSYTLDEILNIFLKIENETTAIIRDKKLTSFLFPPNFELELEKKVELSKAERKQSEKLDFPSLFNNGDFNEIDIEQFLFQNQFGESDSCILKEPVKQKLLVNEAINHIESKEFFDIARFLIKRSFGLLVSNLGDYMKIHGTVVGYDDSREGNNNKNTKIPSKQTPQKEESPIYSIPMIKLIPQISNQTKYDIRGGGAVNMLVQSLASLDELTLFSECIFEL